MEAGYLHRLGWLGATTATCTPLLTHRRLFRLDARDNKHRPGQTYINNCNVTSGRDPSLNPCAEVRVRLLWRFCAQRGYM
jgi:hypothetical protein